MPIDVITKQKPDLILVDRINMKVTLLELSVPFETNIDNTHELKVKRYQQLISDIEAKEFSVKYYPIEIGSRGFISKDNEARLKSFLRKCNAKKYSLVKASLYKIVLLCSFIIYHAKYDDSWVNPKYVTINE